MQVRSGRSARRTDETNNVASAYGLPDGDVNLREVPVTRRHAAAVIDIDYVPIASLPAGNRDLSGRRNFNWSAPGCVDVLAFVIFMAAARKRIATAADTTLKPAEDRPDRWNYATRPQEVFIHAHLVLEFRGLRLQRR